MTICGRCNPRSPLAGVRDVGGAVPQRVVLARVHTAHRLGNRASRGAIPAGAVADVFADAARGPVLPFTPTFQFPRAILVALW